MHFSGQVPMRSAIPSPSLLAAGISPEVRAPAPLRGEPIDRSHEPAKMGLEKLPGIFSAGRGSGLQQGVESRG